MAQRAFHADSTFPQELRKGYKSFFDALRRIPIEEGPYYLFKNTFPLWTKHILGPFTLFYSYDWLKDKTSWAMRVGNMPELPVRIFNAVVATYLATVFTYPFAVTAR
jgi:solute carrier family 25 (mitochondrial oxoglutarate transporter), member 11